MIVLSLVLLSVLPGKALAVKPDSNLAAAKTVEWNLSGDVMPLPWGQHDITGSDTTSKLIVNQPNGNTEVTLTGVMGGLNPNTTYVVYVANGWTTSPLWDVSGSWDFAINYDGIDYTHTISDLQVGGTLGYSGNNKTVTSISIVGDNIVIVADYAENGPGTVTLTGVIDGDGNMSGTWLDSWGGLDRTGNWESTYGVATSASVGNGFPGLFGSLQPFTFLTDEFGSGSWHLNLKDADFSSIGEFTLSVWVNGGGATVLISDSFDVVR